MALTGSISRKSTVRRNRPFEDIQVGNKRKSFAKRAGKASFSVQLSTTAWVLISLLVIGGLIAAVHQFLQSVPCQEPVVSIISKHDNAFMNPNQVLAELELSHNGVLTGTPMGKVDIHALETDLEQNLLVKNAEVYKGFSGGLFAEVEMKEALARVMNTDGSDFYLDWDGHKFPTTREYAAHVPLIRGNFEEALVPVDSFECVTLEVAIPLLKYIREDEFLNGLISDISVKQDGELVLYPQLGTTAIEFGHPIRIEEKFDNLRRFMDQVIAKVGWKKYRRISLEYRGQVVATKRRR